MYIELYIKRREHRMTKDATAKKIGMTPKTYGMKERGVRDFTLREAKALSELFDTPLDELFKEEQTA